MNPVEKNKNKKKKSEKSGRDRLQGTAMRIDRVTRGLWEREWTLNG